MGVNDQLTIDVRRDAGRAVIVLDLFVPRVSLRVPAYLLVEGREYRLWVHAGSRT